MARKRVNPKFVIALAAGVVVAGLGGGFLYHKLHHPKNPLAYIAAGDVAMKSGDFATAIDRYSVAEGLLPSDVQLHLKLGRAYFEGRNLGADNFSNSVTEFTHAEEADPNSKDAWMGLLQTNQLILEQWEAHPGGQRDRERLPASINLVREAAHHLSAIEPNNVEAAAAFPTLVIRVWLLNLSMPITGKDLNPQIKPEDDKPVSLDQGVDLAISQLTTLMRANPENDRIPYWIARAKIQQGVKALQSDRPDDAAPLFAEAATQFDESIAAKPDLVPLYVNKAAILALLKDSDPSVSAGADYRKKIHDSLDKAQSLANPDKKLEYVITKQQWARNLAQSDPARGEQVYRELLKRFPDELEIRLELANMLRHDATRRQDALDLLNAIPSIPPATASPSLKENWERLVALAKIRRADIKTDQLSVMQPGKAYDALSKEIASLLDAAEIHFADTIDLLKSRGRYQLVTGQVRDAIVTLTAAGDKMTAQGSNDYELLRLEAMAYQKGQQNGKAIELLERAIGDPAFANNGDVHVTLAQLQLANQDYDKARQYVDWLAVRYPDDPKVICLEITEYGPNPNLAQIKPLYDRLPEKTPQDVIAKYSVAKQVNNKDDQLRLLELINKQNPGDLAVVSDLAQALKTAGKTDEARAVIDQARKLHPGDATLDILDKVVADVPRTEIDSDAETAIQAIKDPYTRESKLAQLYALRQQPDQEIVHLENARAIQPDNKDLLQTLFVRYMDSQQFAQAQAMIPHLAELDADDAHGLMFKTKLSLAKKDVQASLQYSRQLTHDYPSFSGSWELYGEALRDSGQLDVACQQFTAALALQATNVDATRNLIQCSVQQGKLDDAKSYIQAAQKRFPGDPVYQDMWVQYQILYGDPESVLPGLAQSIKDHPHEHSYYVIDVQALVASMRSVANKGNASQSQDYFQQAKDIFRQILTQWPDDLKSADGFAQLLVESHDLPGAEKVMQTIIARPRWNGRPAPMMLLAEIYMSSGKYDQAEPLLHKVIDANPKAIPPQQALADCLVRQKKFDDALAVLQPLTADFGVRVKYTNLLLDLNRGAQAEVGVEGAIKADPTNSSMVNLLLHVYDVEGKRAEGIKAATDAILNRQDDIFAYYWRAKLLASGDAPDVDASIKDVNYFLNAVPTDLDGHTLLAGLLDAKKDRDGAIHELETALKFAPQDHRVRTALIRDYTTATPPRMVDAEHLITQTLALPAFAHDPDFETQAAMIWASKSSKDDQTKAVTIMQDAMKNPAAAPNLLQSYFDILLTTKNYDLLLAESDKYVSDPKTSWFVFCDRGVAKTALSDTSGADAEFNTALDRASAQNGRAAVEAVAAAISKAAGPEAALAKVLPRTQNSTMWKVVAIDLYMNKNDTTDALKYLESALSGIDTLDPVDRYRLLRQASSIYITVNPPLVDKAVATYQKQLEMNPNDISAMNDMACVLVDMTTPPKPQEALNWSQKAYDLSQKTGRLDTRVYDTQGWVLIQNGRIDDGIDVLHQAVDRSDFPDAHYHLAEGYLKKQLPEDADRELKAAAKLIQDEIDAHATVDEVLRAKIVAAGKEVDDMIKAKTGGKDAASIP